MSIVQYKIANISSALQCRALSTKYLVSYSDHVFTTGVGQNNYQCCRFGISLFDVSCGPLPMDTYDGYIRCLNLVATTVVTTGCIRS